MPTVIVSSGLRRPGARATGVTGSVQDRSTQAKPVTFSGKEVLMSEPYTGYMRCACCGYEGVVTYVHACAACKEGCHALLPPGEAAEYQQHGRQWERLLEERGR